MKGRSDGKLRQGEFNCVMKLCAMPIRGDGKANSNEFVERYITSALKY